MQLITVKQKVKEASQDIDKVIGERIRQRRAVLGLSQQNVSDPLGITYQQLQKYEKGTSKVSASKLFVLAKVLDVKISYFYDGLEELLDLQTIGSLPDTGGTSNSELRRLSKAYSNIENQEVREALLDFVSKFEKRSRQKNH